jgi:hypothetical protein
MFCRTEDFRGITTRYDKRADIFLSAVWARSSPLAGSASGKLATTASWCPGPPTKFNKDNIESAGF